MNFIQSPSPVRFAAEKGTIKSDANFLRFTVQNRLETLNIKTFSRVDINPQGGFVVVTQHQGDLDATCQTFKTQYPKIFVPTQDPSVFMMNGKLHVTVQVDKTPPPTV
ncbi:MAG: hypothetical protein K2X66_14275 [Cyanobacteria bacterium]|nr:hypothetical protein [Cyanobacteriota bacterium]